MAKKKKVVKKKIRFKETPLKPTKAIKNNVRSKTSKKKIERVPTGIKNLDKIIDGGFEKNSTNLIVGGSGNGKSIFAMQFLMKGLKLGESVLYVAFEEKKKDFYRNMLELGWDLEKYEKLGKFFFLSYTPGKIKTMLDEGGGDIEMIVLSKKVQRVVMDSITTFVMLFERDVEMRAQALGLFSLLKGWTCTSLLVYERDPLIDKKQSSRVLEFEADSLIFLYFTRLNRKRERFLEIYKMRGTNHSTNIFPYSIRKNIGIELSPKPYSGKLDRFKST
ncbi:MAG: ATPase domain-containing protein [Nanoarchaeota archaeon]|nr:ATPase domain-containing protein [Nanoarchaeota archaeon]